MSHTPGPWTVLYGGHGTDGYFVIASRGGDTLICDSSPRQLLPEADTRAGRPAPMGQQIMTDDGTIICEAGHKIRADWPCPHCGARPGPESRCGRRPKKEGHDDE